jgi:sugar phosphate isomerase/epimerase
MFKNLNPEALGVSARDSELIELVLSHGFKGLDLDMVALAEQASTQGLDKASRLITSARLKIGSFRLPVRWHDDSPDYKADLERLPALAEMAAKLGCTRSTTAIESGSDARPYHENFEFHRRRLAEIAAVLGAHKIRLGIDFVAPVYYRADRRFQFMQTFDEVLLLLRSTDSTNVGLALDTWHWHLGGGKIEQLRTLSADRIVTVTLADAPEEESAQTARFESRRLGIEGGAIDLPAVLTALAEMRYDGPVTPAPDKSQFGGISRDKLVKAVAASLDQIWKAAGLSPAGKLVVAPSRG